MSRNRRRAGGPTLVDRGRRQTTAPPQRPILPMASTTRGEMFCRTAAGPRTLHQLVLVCVCVRQDGEEVRLRSRTQTAAVKVKTSSSLPPSSSVQPGSPGHVMVLCVSRHALTWSCGDENGHVAMDALGRQSLFLVCLLAGLLF